MVESLLFHRDSKAFIRMSLDCVSSPATAELSTIAASAAIVYLPGRDRRPRQEAELTIFEIGADPARKHPRELRKMQGRNTSKEHSNI
eukprot:3652258-Amphidinium_carterae.1